ncbi:MAG: hypothetical protein CSA72_13410 [Rhodobacterales bacterium]|nr:MAG: hypothetical protein CSA72_13410 [Rhodobacterales bacterium]
MSGVKAAFLTLGMSLLPLQACSDAASLTGNGPLADTTYDVTPPEYVPCKDVVYALARADAMLRQMGQYNTGREAAYWNKRQERLIARAYTCQS